MLKICKQINTEFGPLKQVTGSDCSVFLNSEQKVINSQDPVPQSLQSLICIGCPQAPLEGTGVQVPHLHSVFSLERTIPWLSGSTALKRWPRRDRTVGLQSSTIPCHGTGKAGCNNRALSVLTAAGGILPLQRHCCNFLWDPGRVWKDLSGAQVAWNLCAGKGQGLACVF